MNKLILIIAIIIFSSTITSFGQQVKTKDGVSLGDRNEFINACINSANEKLINIKGVQVETSKYCACMTDNLIPTLYSKDLEKAIKNKSMNELLLKDQNFDILLKCVEGNFKLDDDFQFGQAGNVKLQKEVAVKSCVKEIMEDEEMKGILTNESAGEYCNCAVNKLYEKGFTYKDLQQIDDENSPIITEIAAPCMRDVLQKYGLLESEENNN